MPYPSFILALQSFSSMKNLLSYSLFFVFLWCTGCKKDVPFENLSTPATVPSGFVKYVIPKGEHYAVGNHLKAIQTTELKFTVRFDSSCIYQTADAQNQWDINKLYGFSDNEASHHQYSARIGWRWSEGALRLFAYTYNNAVRESKEIATIPIGAEVNCSIKIRQTDYLFMVGENAVALPRLSTTTGAKGYQLYPYFGGDEVAPHEVRIWIKEVN
jgi:hypothetical protein